MERLTSWLKVVLLFGGILLCAKAYLVLDRVDVEVHAVSSELQTVTAKLTTDIEDARTLIAASTETVKATTGTINAARKTLDATRPSVLLALEDSHHLLLEAGLTAMEARKAAAEQRAYFSKISSDSDTLIKQLGSVADSANKSIQDADTAVKHLDKVISDPAIPSTLNHADKILADGEKVADRLAAPVNTAKKALSFVWNSLLHYFGAK